MRVEMIQTSLKWPKEISVRNLRPWIVSQIAKQGEPLRWAIMSVCDSADSLTTKELKIEAVVILIEYVDVEK